MTRCRPINHAANSGRHSVAVRGDDLYETPPEAVRALLKVESLPESIWEPACGPGAIVGVLRAAGHRVYATDLRDYGCPDSRSRIDFLREWAFPSPVSAIVTNPPYKQAGQFVAHALTLCPRVVMLLRLAFLESEQRSSILENCGLARVHVFRKRLPMMHRHGWQGPRASSSIPFAWFVWDRAYRGETKLARM